MWCKMILADFVAECNLSHEDSFKMRVADLRHYQDSRISHSVYHNFLTFDFFFFFFFRPRSSGAASALSVAPASSSPYKPLTFTLVPLLRSSDDKEPSEQIIRSQTDKDCQVKINKELYIGSMLVVNAVNGTLKLFMQTKSAELTLPVANVANNWRK